MPCIILQLALSTPIQTLIFNGLTGKNLHSLPIQIGHISPLYF